MKRIPHDSHIRTWFRECVISIEDVERAGKLARHIPCVLANHGVVCSKSYDEALCWWMVREGLGDGANFKDGVLVEKGT